jgi:hypothetical protein
MGLTPHVRLASPPGGGKDPVVADSLGTTPNGANASDIALEPYRCECVGCRLRLPSVQTRPTTPSTPIGTKPEGLVYPSPRLPLRSCGYLGFRTHPPLNPVGVVYAVTCGFTSALKAPPDPHWAPQIHPESNTVRAHLYIIGFAPQPPQTGPLPTPIRSPNRSLTTTTALSPRRPARPLKPPSQYTVTYFPTMA